MDESNPALQGFLSWELWRRHKVRMNLLIKNIYVGKRIYFFFVGRR